MASSPDRVYPAERGLKGAPPEIHGTLSQTRKAPPRSMLPQSIEEIIESMQTRQKALKQRAPRCAVKKEKKVVKRDDCPRSMLYPFK